MRVEGDDKAGLGGRLTQAWEMAGINLHGLVMSVIGGKFVGYVTFDTRAGRQPGRDHPRRARHRRPARPGQGRQRGDQAVIMG